MSLIEIKDLTFSYASQQHEPALRNLSCSIEQGSFVGITGLAEAGKSSFCRLIAGYIPHFFHGEFSGRVNVAGTDTRETTIGELAERVGFVFENPFDQLTGASLTVLEEAAFALENMGLAREEIRLRAEKSLSQVGMEDLKNRHLQQLSGGQSQRLLWPYIVTSVGIGILWLAAFGFTTQLFLNMEIERYTLATGETAVAGFTRFWKPWGIVFVLGAILPNLFPGWVTSSSTMITYTLGLSEGIIPYLAIGLLVTIGLIASLSPVVYQSIEKIEMVLVSIILVFLVVGIFVATKGSSWAGVITQAPQGVADFPKIMGAIGAATMLGAIAFAGAGGANNLVQSNYVRDKGLGMGPESQTSSPRSPARRRPGRHLGTPSRSTRRTCAAGKAGGGFATWSRGASSTA
jgi:ABC-type ATPase involved in cell division